MHFIHRLMRSSRLRNGFILSLTLLLALLMVMPALAAPGDLDNTWGGTGLVTTDLDGAGNTYQGLIKLLPYPGDKVIGLAHYVDAPSQFVLVRYNEDGSLDNTFGTNGVFIVPLTPNGPSQDDTAADMVVQPDGKIVVVGNTYPNPGGRIHVGGVRVNTNGTLDTSFDGDGYLDIDATLLELSISGESSYSASVTLQADNKIIITGGMSRTNYDGAGMVMRLNTDGSRDTSFGGNGIVSFDYVAGDAFDRVEEAVVQPDGKIVIASMSETDPAQGGVNYDFVAARFNTNGTLDTGFSGDGKVAVDVSLVEFGLSDEQDNASGLILQDDGKIILAGGATNDTVNYAGDVALVRFNANGSLDTGFGGNGIVTTAINNRDEYANAIALQENGKFVVVGTADKPDSGANDSMILRYNSDGTLDNTFSGDGKLTFNFGSSSEFGYDVAIQPDGQILAVVTNGQPYPGGYVLFSVRIEGDPVGPANVAPELTDITNKTVDEGSLLSFTATATDADVPAQTLAFSLEPGAPAGAAITSGGNFTWTPSEAQGPGSYTITVKVTDSGTGSLSDTDSFNVTVNEINTAPDMTDITDKTVNEGALLSFTATATDSDLPANTLSYTLEAGAPAGAAITTGGDFTWTPGETHGGSVYTITVRVSDGSLSDTDSFDVTVNEANTAPQMTDITDKTVDEGALLSFTATATDSDIPANTLSFSLEAGAPTGAAITAGGDFTWTPSEAQGPGTYPITVKVTDSGAGNLSDTDTFSVTVNEANTPPVLTDITNKTVNEGELLSFTATASDNDQPANTLTFSLEAGAPAGAAITTGGAFTWTPDETHGGNVYTITVKVTDNGTGNLTDTDSFDVTVNEANTPPVMTDITDKTVDEGSLLSFTAAATDSDIPANTLTYTLEAGAPTGAAITPGGDFTWTPDETQGPGTYTITVKVTDSGAGNLSDTDSFDVTVNEANTPPAVTDITNKTVNEGELLSFTATATDSDQPANTLTFSLEAGAPAGAAITAGGDFTWTPDETQGPGTYTITVKVTDSGVGNLSDTDSFDVTVNEVNTPPVMTDITDKTVDEGSLLSFTAGASDGDIPANTLTYTLEPGAPTGAAITAGGDFTWTPTETQGPGTYTITVKVTDDGTPNMSHTDSFNVTVNEVNTPPVMIDITDKTVNEGELLSFTATASDGDIPANTLTYTLEAGAPTGAAITAGGDFTWTPDETHGGSIYTITVRVTDSGTPNLSHTDSFSVTVSETNVAPVMTDITDKTVNEGELLSFTASASDSDIPVQALSYTLEAGAPAGAAITAGGDFTWTPDETQGPGTYTITVRVTDNGAPNLSGTETFNVTVNEINVQPAINPIASPIAADEGVQLSFTVSATDADLPANTLTYSLGATAPTGVNINPSSGLFTWTPDETQGPGSYTFDVMVTDNGAPILSATQSITINVSEVNIAPELDPIGNKVVDELTLLTFTANGSDDDDPANTLTYSLDAPTPGNATIDPNTGVFTWTPDDVLATTTYYLRVRVTDNGTPALDDFELISVVVRNPSDVFDLANGGFEEAGATQKDALNWNETDLTTTDRRICNTTTPLKVHSYSGECAFRFNYGGITNLQRKIVQTLTLPTVVVGDTVRLDFWAKASTLTNGVKVQLRLNYTDGTNDVVNLPMPTGTYDYAAFTVELPVAKALTSVRVMLRADAANGSIFFDDFAITRMVGAPLTMGPIEQRNGESGIIPVPAAPSDLRGGGSVGGE